MRNPAHAPRSPLQRNAFFMRCAVLLTSFSVATLACAVPQIITTVDAKLENLRGQFDLAGEQTGFSFTGEPLEILFEAKSRGNPGTRWFSSAYADKEGNLEVGVDNDPASGVRGESVANSVVTLIDTYNGGPRPASVEFTLQAGEILFETDPRVRGAPGFGSLGQINAFLSMDLNGTPIDLFQHSLILFSTDTGFEIDPRSSSTGLLSIDSVSAGTGGVWGVRTKEFTGVAVLPPLEVGDKYSINYSMAAIGDMLNPIDQNLGISAKIGDPLDFVHAGGLRLITDSDAPPPPPVGIALPNSFSLLLAAAAAALLQRRYTVSPASR